MRLSISHFSFLFLLLWIPISVNGQDIPFQSELPYDQYSEMDEPFSTEHLIRLSLLSSGVSGTMMDHYENELYTLLKGSERVLLDVQPDEKADVLLQYMHETVLKRYVLNQTRIDTLLDNGQFNCVSSAVLYMILCRYHGILVSGIQAEDHAFCTINLENEIIDVETTNEWGYNPGSRKEFESTFTRTTGYAYVPPGNYGQRISMGDKDMAGLILQNRIVDLQKSHKHRDALVLGADRFRLTGSSAAENDYYNVLQNACAQLNNERRYLEAVNLIDQLEDSSIPIPDALRSTRSQLIFNASARYINENEIQKAENTVQANTNRLLPAELNEINALISRRKLEVKAGLPFSEEIVEEIRNGMTQSILTESQGRKLAAYHYILHANHLASQDSNEKAFMFLKEAALWVHPDSEYKRILAILKQNTAIDYHNSIVLLLNEEKNSEASALLNQALSVVPDSHILLKDKKYFQN